MSRVKLTDKFIRSVRVEIQTDFWDTGGRVLAHADPRGVTSVYDRYTFDSEVKRAMLAWDRRFHQIVTGVAPSRVVAMDAAFRSRAS